MVATACGSDDTSSESATVESVADVAASADAAASADVALDDQPVDTAVAAETERYENETCFSYCHRDNAPVKGIQSCI